MLLQHLMSISHDDYVPVNMDELMTVHTEKTIKRFDMVSKGSIADSCRKDEQNISKEHKTSANTSSQECVENMSKRYNRMWTSNMGCPQAVK